MAGIAEQVDMHVERIDEGPLTVNFKGKLRPDGEFARVSLSQFGAHIELTIEQAKSLAAWIEAKLK
jgi:hypothetical protein